MKVAVVFEPDPDLGPDPLDEAKQPRRLGEFLDSERLDVLLVWKEFGDQFEGGSRTHVIGSGVWENVNPDAMDEVLDRLGDLT